MPLFVTILHVFLCIALAAIILLQPAKEGANLLGGGGANQEYGPRSQANPLGRATTIIATLFMVTSITLAWYSSKTAEAGSDLTSDIKRLEQEQQKEQTRIKVPEVQLPTPDEPGNSSTGDQRNSSTGDQQVPAADNQQNASTSSTGDDK